MLQITDILPTDVKGFYDTAASEITDQIIKFVDAADQISGYIAGAIMLIFVTHKIVVSFLKPNEPINPGTLVRPILIIVAIGLYTNIMAILVNPKNDPNIDDPISILDQAIAFGAQEAGVPGYQEDAYETLTHTQLSGGPGGGGISDVLIYPALELIHLIIYFIAIVCVAYILFKQLVMKSFYYIIGIFVLPFSLIPGNEKSLNKWFFGYISVLLWAPLLNIMMFLIHAVDYSGTDFENPIFSFAFQIMMIFLILNVPKYANIIVGGEGSEAGVANAIKKAPGRIYGGAKLAQKAGKALTSKKA